MPRSYQIAHHVVFHIWLNGFLLGLCWTPLVIGSGNQKPTFVGHGSLQIPSSPSLPPFSRMTAPQNINGLLPRTVVHPYDHFQTRRSSR